MRVRTLAIEKYGPIERRVLDIPENADLCIVFGPNEAGKSTTLSAFGDFLYGIPHSSSYGQIFGYDQMRLSADIIASDGTRLSVRRRKGRSGRTLTDDAGNLVDEAALGRLVGSTDRERFDSLFGLDHRSLRTGGERMLQSDGDIGRLIVEAGGGLRSLIDAADQLRVQADALFTTRRSSERAFYQALDRLNASDQEFKRRVLTREAFDTAARDLAAARERQSELRERIRQLGERSSELKRLERIVPRILELDQIESDLAEFADLPTLPRTFPEDVRVALESLQSQTDALAETQRSWEMLRATVEQLSPNQAVLDRSEAIEELLELTASVKKARSDRQNRMKEISDATAIIEGLRHQIGLSTEIDIETCAPLNSTCNLVQRLAEEEMNRRGIIQGFVERINDDRRTLAQLESALERARQARRDKPLGLSATDFATAVERVEGVVKIEDRIAHDERELASDLLRLGFDDIEALKTFPCPDADVIQAEMERRNGIASDISRLDGEISLTLEAHGRAMADIERLSSAGDIPTREVLSEARKRRDDLWRDIRDRYVSPNGQSVVERPAVDRQTDAVQYAERTSAADQLSDRHAIEANRIAGLDQATRDKVESEIALDSKRSQRKALEGRNAELNRAWMEAWPEAATACPDLGRLKRLWSERNAILGRAAALADMKAERASRVTRRDECLAALERLEQWFELPSEGVSLAERVRRGNAVLEQHSADHADYRADMKRKGEISANLDGTEASLAKRQTEQEEWRANWVRVIEQLGVPADTSPDRANAVATAWIEINGHLSALRLTRTRIAKMDEDETNLANRFDRLRGDIGITLPDDPVQAAVGLRDELTRARETAANRGGLMIQLSNRAAELNDKRDALERTQIKIRALCQRAGCSEPELPLLAERCTSYLNMEQKRQECLDRITELGDGLSLSVLREQWAGRQIDAIRAEQSVLIDDIASVTEESEDAAVQVKDKQRVLEEFSASSDINAAAMSRESAKSEIASILDRYLEIALARDLLTAAIERVRNEQQSPLLLRAGELFSAATLGAFKGIETDIDDAGNPVVIGCRAPEGRVHVSEMSDGTRDQLFLSFRIAAIEQYCMEAEPLPFIADDLLVHFDDDRSVAMLRLLAALGRTTQVLLFTHHRQIVEAAKAIPAREGIAVVELT